MRQRLSPQSIPPSVLWLSSYTSRRCSPALWQEEEEEEEAGGGRRRRGGGRRETGAASHEGWVMWEERDGGGGGGGGGGMGEAGHSVIQRVVSPRSAAGRGFTAKRKKRREREQKLLIH